MHARTAVLALLVAPLFVQCSSCEKAEPAPVEPTVATDVPDGGEWIQLFDGRSLDGWTPKFKGHELGENVLDTFRVEDGLLTVAYDGYEEWGDRFGHLFHAVPFSHYVLRAEYRFVGEQVPGAPGWAWRNNGLMIHGQDPATMARDQSFPVSLEVQLLGGGADGERPNGNLCTPGTHVVMDGELVTRHCINTASRTYRDDEWVVMEVRVHGGELVEHVLEGEVVMAYGAPQLDPDDADAARLLAGGAEVGLTGGTISIQAESSPIQFRRIEVLVLEPGE